MDSSNRRFYLAFALVISFSLWYALSGTHAHPSASPALKQQQSPTLIEEEEAVLEIVEPAIHEEEEPVIAPVQDFNFRLFKAKMSATKTRLGTDYGGFPMPDMSWLNKDSIVYGFGLGEDVSW